MTGLLLDTSAAVPFLVASHEAHEQVVAAIGDRTVALCGHALHETYAVLTRLPGGARVAPRDAVRLIEERFQPAATLSARTFRSIPSELASSGIAGGATYDGLIALAARHSGIPLGSRDARALSTYRLLGADVEVLASR